mgnify:CR=1 FL=1
MADVNDPKIIKVNFRKVGDLTWQSTHAQGGDPNLLQAHKGPQGTECLDDFERWEAQHLAKDVQDTSFQGLIVNGNSCCAPWYLHCIVKSAMDLKGVDRNGKSDPYCVVCPRNSALLIFQGLSQPQREEEGLSSQKITRPHLERHF